MLTNYYTLFVLSRKNDPARSTTAVAYSAIGSYKGFIQPISGNENYRDGKGGEAATHRLYTDVSTPAKYGDRVEQNSQTYLVLYAIQPDGISSVNHHKEIILAVFE